jgi:hypothetical protein
MRAGGVRGLLVYCSDFKCSHGTAISGDRWPDAVRLSTAFGVVWPRLGGGSPSRVGRPLFGQECGHVICHIVPEFLPGQG